MQQTSSIDLMRAETDREFRTADWMNIRFTHTLIPLAQGGKATKQEENEGMEAEGGHPALDAHEQLSATGRADIR